MPFWGGRGGAFLLISFYSEDDGFRPWPNLPVGAFMS